MMQKVMGYNIPELEARRDIEGLTKALKEGNGNTVRERGDAAVALGKVGDKVAVDALVETLEHDSDYQVRGHVAWALGELEDMRAVDYLIKALNSDGNGWTRSWAAIALCKLGDKCAVEQSRGVLKELKDALKDDDENVRFSAVEALGELGDQNALPALEEVANDPDEDVGKETVKSIKKIVNQTIKNSELRIQKAKDLGIDIFKVKEQFERAKDAISNAEFDKAIEYAEEINKYTGDLIEKNRPKLSLSLISDSPEPFEFNVIKRIYASTTNVGSMHAKYVKPELSGKIEVDYLNEPFFIGVGERKSINIGIKPERKGELQIKFSWKYRDVIDREYEDSETLLLKDIPPVRPESPPKPIMIHSTVYDPITKDFVLESEFELAKFLRVKTFIEERSPIDYWFILRIDNNTKDVFVKWAVELKTPRSLLIGEDAYIDFKEKKLASKGDYDYWTNKYVLAISEEDSIIIPPDQSSFICFKLNIDSKERLVHRYTISGKVIADSNEEEIPRKTFPYSCKDIELMEAPKEAAVSFVNSVATELYALEAATAVTESFGLLKEINEICSERLPDETKLKGKIKSLCSSLEAVKELTGIQKPLSIVEENLSYTEILGLNATAIIERWNKMDLFDVMGSELLKNRVIIMKKITQMKEKGG